MTCRHCGDRLASGNCDHAQQLLCCDCFDLSWFHDDPRLVDQLNRERAAKGKPPLPERKP